MIKHNAPEEEFDLDAELSKLEALFGKKEGEEEKELHKVDIDELFNEVMASDLKEKPLRPVKEIFETEFRSKPHVVKEEIKPALVVAESEKTRPSSKRLRQLVLFSLVVGTFCFAHFMGSTLKQDLGELEGVAQETVAVVSDDIKTEENALSAVGGVTPATTPVEQTSLKEDQPVAEENKEQTGEQLPEERDAKLQAAAEQLSQASKTDRSQWINLLETRRQLTELPRQRMEHYLKEGPALEISEEAQFLLNNLEAYKTRLKQYLADYQEAMKQGIAPQYRKYHQAIASSLQRQVNHLETVQKEWLEWSGKQEQELEKEYPLMKQHLGQTLAFVPAPYFSR